MKKKIFQRLLSMVLVVGMMMPTVSAYGEIANPQPLYDQPTVEIIDGEKVEWEVVDGSQIDGGTSGRKYYVQFVRKDGYYGPEMDQKPSDGRPYRTVPYPPDVRVVNQLVKDATTITTTETYTVHETRSGVRRVEVTPARTVSVRKTRPKEVFDRQETIIITPERHITKYRTVEKRVVDVAAHYKSVRVLVRSGYYRNDYTVDHDGVPIVKKVWVPARYRTENRYVPATYKNVTVTESYVETIPAVTYVKKYYKTIQEVYYEDEYRPAVYEDQHYTYTVPVQKTRTITTHVPAEYREVTITTNKDKYEYWYEPTERIASKTLLEAITLWHTSGQTSTGYIHQGRMYDNSGALWTGIVQRNGNYYENGRLIDFEPGIYTSSQGKYKTLQEKISKESTAITIYDHDGNSSSGYYYNGQAHLSDGTFVPSGYYYNLGGSIYDASGNIDEDFDLQIYQSSNGKYLNSTDRKEQLVSEISGLNKGTVSGNNRLYEIYRDYPEVRDHVVAKGPFHYASIENGEYLEPSTSPRELKSSTVLEIVSETDYNENHLLKEIAYLDKLNRQDYEKLYNYYHSSSTSEAAKAAIRAKGPFYYHDTSINAIPPYFKELEPKYNEQRYEIVSYEQYLEGTKKTLAHNESIAPYVRNIIGDNQNDTEGFIYAVVEGTTYHFQGSVHVGLNGDLIFGYNDGNLYPQEFGSFNEYIQSEEHRVSYFTKDAYELYKDSLPTAEKSPLEVLQDALGIVGMIPIPGVGEVADILNALIYFTRAAVEEDSQERKNLILKGSGSLLLAVGLIAAEKVIGKYVIPAVIKNTPEAIDALARYLYTQDIDLKLAFEGISYALKGMSGKLDSIGTWLGKYTARSFGDAVLNLNKGLVKQIDSLDRFVSNTFTDLMDVLPYKGTSNLIDGYVDDVFDATTGAVNPTKLEELATLAKSDKFTDAEVAEIISKLEAKNVPESDLKGLFEAYVKETNENITKFWEAAVQFDGKKVYKRSDLIDPSYVDDIGRTNIQRMEAGLAPIGPDGKSINLHHMTQMDDGAIAEVTQTFHQKNSKVIHVNPNTIPSGIDRTAFDKWKKAYWKNRATEFN